MADISMCLNKGCSRKESCYRFTAPVNPEWQSYDNYQPDPDGDCEGFKSNGI